MRGALVEVNAGHVELLGDVDAELGVHLDAALGDHRAERLDIVTDHALPRDLLAGLDVDGQGLELDTDGLHRGVGSEQTWSGGEHGQGERCAKDGTAGRSDHGDSVSCCGYCKLALESGLFRVCQFYGRCFDLLLGSGSLWVRISWLGSTWFCW